MKKNLNNLTPWKVVDTLSQEHIAGFDLMASSTFKNEKKFVKRSDDYLLKKCFDGSSTFFETNTIPTKIIHEFFISEVERVKNELANGNADSSLNYNLLEIISNNIVWYETLDYFFTNKSVLDKLKVWGKRNNDNLYSRFYSEIKVLPIEIIEKFNLGLTTFFQSFKITNSWKVDINMFAFKAENNENLKAFIDHTNNYLKEHWLISLMSETDKIGETELLWTFIFSTTIWEKNPEEFEKTFKKLYYKLADYSKFSLLWKIDKTKPTETLLKFTQNEYVKLFFTEKITATDTTNAEIIERILDIYEKFPTENISSKLPILFTTIPEITDKMASIIISEWFVANDFLIKIIPYLNKKSQLSTEEKDYLDSINETDGYFYLVTSKHITYDTKKLIIDKLSEDFEKTTDTKNHPLFKVLRSVKDDLWEEYTNILTKSLMGMWMMDILWFNANYWTQYSTDMELVKKILKKSILIENDTVVGDNWMKLLELWMFEDEDILVKYVNWAVWNNSYWMAYSKFPGWNSTDEKIKAFYTKLIAYPQVSKQHILSFPTEAILENIDLILWKSCFNDLPQLLSIVDKKLRTISSEEYQDKVDLFISLISKKFTTDEESKNLMIQILTKIASAKDDKKIWFNLDDIDNLKKLKDLDPILAKRIFWFLLTIRDFKWNSDNNTIFMILFWIPEFKDEMIKNPRGFSSMRFTLKNFDFLEKKGLKLDLKFFNFAKGNREGTISSKPIPISKTNLNLDDIDSVKWFLQILPTFDIQPTEKNLLVTNIAMNLDKYSKYLCQKIEESHNDILLELLWSEILSKIPAGWFNYENPKAVKKLIDVLWKKIYSDYGGLTTFNGKTLLGVLNKDGLFNLVKSLDYFSTPVVNIIPSEIDSNNSLSKITQLLDDNIENLAMIWKDSLNEMVSWLLREMPNSKTTDQIIKKYYKYMSDETKIIVLSVLWYYKQSDTVNELMKDKISTMRVLGYINKTKKDPESNSIPINAKNRFYLKNKDWEYANISHFIGRSWRNSADLIIDVLQKDLAKNLPDSMKKKLLDTEAGDVYVKSLSSLYSVFINDKVNDDEFSKVREESQELIDLLGFDWLYEAYIRPIIQSASIPSVKLVTKLTKLFDKEWVKKIVEKVKLESGKV